MQMTKKVNEMISSAFCRRTQQWFKWAPDFQWICLLPPFHSCKCFLGHEIYLHIAAFCFVRVYVTYYVYPSYLLERLNQKYLLLATKRGQPTEVYFFRFRLLLIILTLVFKPLYMYLCNLPTYIFPFLQSSYLDF